MFRHVAAAVLYPASCCRHYLHAFRYDNCKAGRGSQCKSCCGAVIITYLRWHYIDSTVHACAERVRNLTSREIMQADVQEVSCHGLALLMGLGSPAVLGEPVLCIDVRRADERTLYGCLPGVPMPPGSPNLAGLLAYATQHCSYPSACWPALSAAACESFAADVSVILRMQSSAVLMRTPAMCNGSHLRGPSRGVSVGGACMCRQPAHTTGAGAKCTAVGASRV